jgi:Ca-activated chloride channel homolog
MAIKKAPITLLAVSVVFAVGPLQLQAQDDKWTNTVVIPQLGCYGIGHSPKSKLVAVDARIRIIEQVAITECLLTLQNTSDQAEIVDLLIPVPGGAVVKDLRCSNQRGRVSARLLSGKRTSKLWLKISSLTRRPSMIEFHNYSAILARALSVKEKSVTTIKVCYEQVLAKENNRLDYTLPRSESYDAVLWSIAVDVQGARALSAIYSPSHEVTVERVSPHHLKAQLKNSVTTDPGPFRCSILFAKKGVSATLFTYPEGAGGYFLLLAGVPTKTEEMRRKSLRREVTIVLDRSGSMRGQKSAQAREAALRIVAGLDAGERFNVITYSHFVDSFRDAPVAKSRRSLAELELYLTKQKAFGGTNISAALNAALSPKPARSFLPIVLFLTDGVPTLGETDEAALTGLINKQNKWGHRIFTFGVGLDVNTPLLQNMSAQSRAQATFVLPRENIEVKVSKVFGQLEGPVLAAPELNFFDVDGANADHRVRAMRPARLPDLFDGDQFIAIGRYRGTKPLIFRVMGNFCGQKETFQFKFKMNSREDQFSFVPRLWASRQIGFLIESIRRLGVQTSGPQSKSVHLKELIDEVVFLSTKYGILTEYTAFLAASSTDLSQKEQILARAKLNFVDRAMRTRSGKASINQELNNMRQKKQSCLNYKNWHCDKKLNKAAIAGVKKFSDRAFYGRGDCWIDSRIVQQPGGFKNNPVIHFGSKEYKALIERLTKQGRQGCLSMSGDVLLKIGDSIVRIKTAKNNK